MSRILKASNVTVDDNNRVNIEILDVSKLNQNKADTIKNAVNNEDDITDNPDIQLSPEDEYNRIVNKAKSEAEGIILKAKLDSEKILEDAKNQAQQYIHKLEEQSRDEGYTIGYNQGMSEAEALKKEAQKNYEDALAQREETINSIESDMLELISNILNKLLANSVKINPQIIMGLIKQGVSNATITGDIFIHVSEADYEYVLLNKAEIISLIDASSKVEIVKDTSLNQSDCIIETSFGNIDCSLDQQYNSLKENLYYIFENR